MKDSEFVLIVLSLTLPVEAEKVNDPHAWVVDVAAKAH